MKHSGYLKWLRWAFALLGVAASPLALAVTYANTSVPFNWVDSSTQTVVGYNTSPYKFNFASGCGTTPPRIDDTISDAIPLGFTFMYGGMNFTTVRIMSNGRLQFNNNTTCGYGSPVTQLPYPNANLNYTMRIFGNDLDPTLLSDVPGYQTICTNRASCYVSYGAYGVAPYRSFVVTWFGVPEWTGFTTSAAGSYNLQIILQENGEFIYQYGTDIAGPQATLGQVGWQVSTSDYDVTAVGFPAPNTALKYYIPRPVAEYRMEQPNWIGTAGEVIDSSGNGRNAATISVGAGVKPQTVDNVAGYICRGAGIPANTAAANIGAIDTNISIPTTVGGTGTITFWHKPASATAWNGAGSVEAMLFDATTANNAWFYLVKYKISANSSGLRFVVRDSDGTLRAAQTAAVALDGNGAIHVGVSWNFNALAGTNQDHLRIYVNGVYLAATAFTSSGTVSPNIGTLYIGDNRSAFVAAAAYGNSANGVIDEFRIYNYEGGLALVQRDQSQANACLNHYAISHAGVGTTCSPTQVTITAHDIGDGNVIMPNNTTTITLSTNSGTGDWSKIAGYGVLTNGTANDGSATYLFNGEYQAILGLTHTTATTVNIGVTDGQLTEPRPTPPALPSSEDPDLVISSGCSSAVSFLVEAPASGSTCGGASSLGAVVTVTAKDGAAGTGSTVTTYTGTVNLTTSTGHGSWNIVPGQAQGTLMGNQYTFAAADNGVAKFYLSDFVAETITATVSDAVVPTVNGTSGSITYAAYSFLVQTNDTMGGTVAATASTVPVAGRNHGMKISLYNGCIVDTNYSGNKNLDIWYSPAAGHPGGAAAPQVSPAASGALPSAKPSANSASNNWPAVPFAAGVATYNLVTTDIGQYSLGVRDDTRAYVAAADIAGSSPILTIRPFGLYVAVAGNVGTSTGGTSALVAGTNFSGDVKGIQWANGDDANSDGIPDANADLSDNAVTPGYAWPTALTASNTGFTPVGGTLGTFSNANILQAGFSGGSATENTLQYSEVGSFTLQASATGFLGTAGADISTGTIVGRFRPDHFAVGAGTPTPGSGSFTYFGQDGFTTNFTLTAQNALNATTANYTGSYAKLDPAVYADFHFATLTALPAGASLSQSATALSGSWSNGAISVAAKHQVSRPTALAGETMLVVTAKPVDTDGVTTASATQVSSAALALRYGRLWLGNAFGSDRTSLSVPYQYQYWNGNAFVRNTADTSSSFAVGNMTLANYQGGITNATVTSANLTVNPNSSGAGSITLAAPASAASGSVDLAVNLGAAPGASRAYLQYPWGGGAAINPTSRATFGVYSGGQRRPPIFIREN